MSHSPLARLGFGAVFAVALVLLSGCGGSSKGVTVSGKLVLPAKVKVVETDSINVTFVPEDAATGKSAAATVNAKDLTFTGEVLPGKYKVGVTVTPYAGMKDAEARAKELTQQLGAFASNTTSLRYEVTSSSGQTITVDLTKPAVTSP